MNVDTEMDCKVTPNLREPRLLALSRNLGPIYAIYSIFSSVDRYHIATFLGASDANSVFQLVSQHLDLALELADDLVLWVRLLVDDRPVPDVLGVVRVL